MPILSKPAFGPQTALAYITGGALIDVWTLVWYFTRDHELNNTSQFWIIGLVLTGVTFVVLGILLGPIGRAARHAELPPVEAMRAQTEIDKIAAANIPASNIPATTVPPAAPVVMAPTAPPGTVLSQARGA